MSPSLTRDHSMMYGKKSEFEPPSFDGILLFVHSSDACCADHFDLAGVRCMLNAALLYDAPAPART